MRITPRLPLAFLLLALPLSAQGPAPKRVLTQADWDHWRSITGAALSYDGKWAAYTLVPQVGDGELVIRSTLGSTEYRVPRGYLGRPNNVPGGLRPPVGGTGEGETATPTASPAQFTADNRFVVVTTQPFQAEVERMQANRAGRGGRGTAAANRTALAIVDLSDGQVTTIPAVRSFRLPWENGTWLAYLVEADSAGADSTNHGSRAGVPRRTFGSPLVLRNLGTGVEERLADVLSYSFDDAGTVVAYTVVSRDSTRDGAYLRSMGSGTTATLANGRGNYKALALDSAARQVAFLSDREEFGRDKARYALYYAQLKGGGAQPVVTPGALATDYRISDVASVSFTRTGNAILFGVARLVPDSVPADSLSDKAVFDLWHYKDPTLQPTQRLGAARERNRSFQAVFFPASKKLVQLASDSIPTLDISDDGRIV